METNEHIEEMRRKKINHSAGKNSGVEAGVRNHSKVLALIVERRNTIDSSDLRESKINHYGIDQLKCK